MTRNGEIVQERMATVDEKIARGYRPNDEVQLVDRTPVRLTTEHAASSYGQPVLVLPDGSALTQAEFKARFPGAAIEWSA